MTKGQQDGTTTPDFNTTGTGYLQLDIRVPNNDYIKEQTVTPYGLLTNCSAVRADPYSYYCSVWSTSSTNSICIGSIGGTANDNTNNVSSMYFSENVSGVGSINSSLSYHAP